MSVKIKYCLKFLKKYVKFTMKIRIFNELNFPQNKTRGKFNSNIILLYGASRISLYCKPCIFRNEKIKLTGFNCTKTHQYL